MFAFHIFFSGLSPRSIVRLDESIWSLKHHNLVTWRHPLRLWSDGFTVDDGPLHSYEEPTGSPCSACFAQSRTPEATRTEPRRIACAGICHVVRGPFAIAATHICHYA